MESVIAQSNEKAADLRALHLPGQPLVVPNAWDAASAQIIERSGFPAVATSSNAVAACLGWDDGESAPVQSMLTSALQIARAVTVPVTIDFERGYGLEPEELVRRFTLTDAVGLNLEDSNPTTGNMIELNEQVNFIRAIRAAAQSIGSDLVINARTDSFLRGAGSPEEQLVASIDRGNHYLGAGADCVYPLGAVDPAAIRALVQGIDGPINIARGAESPLTITELAGLGVARVTFGPGLQRSVYAWFETQVLPRLLMDAHATAPNR
ncbi:MAG: isocitrate lyase/phosphoenolpyruvate mutase family protein [Nocardioidaceae bacterium]